MGVDPVEETVQLGRRQLEVGVNREKHRAVLNQAHADVANLVEAIQPLRRTGAANSRFRSA